jgi:uncharacterized membrane protein YoaK (UPF0700 family)
MQAYSQSELNSGTSGWKHSEGLVAYTRMRRNDDTRFGGEHVSDGRVNLACLSLVSGCIDVLSFVELRDLFASAMTGNTALLALAMSRGDWLAASRSLSALLAFGLGVALGTLMYPSKHQSTRSGIRWLLVLELIFLTGCSILWSASSGPVEGGTLYAVIGLLALSMGIQAVVARSINSLGVNTVVFTSALIRVISATGALRRRAALASLSNIKTDLETLAAYGCGAAVAGMLVAHHLGTLIWFPAATVLIALVLSELVGKPEGST